MTRTIGYVLLVAAAGAALIGLAFLGSGIASGNLEPAGAILGAGLLLLLLVAPLAGAGVVVLVKSKEEAATEEKSKDLRQILDMVETRGQLTISDVIIELNLDRPQVQEYIYELVGMGVFDGYVNWDEGMLYSTDASELKDLNQCKNCGGQITIAGKGVFECPFCGTEYFVSK